MHCHGFVVAVFIVISVACRVVDVTQANVHLVVRSVGTLPLLLHNPLCPHSQAYHQKFVSISTEDTVGVADCSKEKQLCEYLNATHYPSLLSVSNSIVEPIDSHQYLSRHDAISPTDQQSLHQSLLALLKDQTGWAAVVLEEQHLPTVDRIQHPLQNRVVYVPNPSTLYDALKGLIGHKLGCWILKNNNKSEPFHRYYCGTGYKSDELAKHLSHFKSSKMERYLFTRPSDEKYIEGAVLAQMVSDAGRRQQTQCRFVYFHSKECFHCRDEDLEVLREVVKGRSRFAGHLVQLFDLDQQEYPSGLRVESLPELMQFCDGKVRVLEGPFTFKNMKNFLRADHAEKSQLPSSASQL